MKKSLLTGLSALALVAGMSAPAMADGWHRYHGGSSFGFGFYAPAYPAYGYPAYPSYSYYPAYPAYPVAPAYRPVPRYHYVAPPVEEADNYDDEYCREYQSHVSIGGRTHRTYGTACEQPDGTWRIVN